MKNYLLDISDEEVQAFEDKLKSLFVVEPLN